MFGSCFGYVGRKGYDIIVQSYVPNSLKMRGVLKNMFILRHSEFFYFLMFSLMADSPKDSKSDYCSNCRNTVLEIKTIIKFICKNIRIKE